MATHLLLLLLVVLVLLPLSFLHLASAANNPPPPPSPFITSSCQLTRYQDLCISSLSPYSASIKQNDHRRLALAALSVSLSTARSASAYVSRVAPAAGRQPTTRVSRAVQDCSRNMADGVARLSQSVRELGQMSNLQQEDKFQWHMSNLQTWVSAALTCQNSCVDGFSARELDGAVKDGIRRRVVYVAKVTSNALALIHGFAAKHARPGRLH